MADTTVVNFRTPQEFIEYYSNNLKAEMSLYDIQVNKLGFIGFLLNLLGHTSYDVKQYYDSLFKESFVATSQDTENLYFHAATYGYLPTFATPAKAYGDIAFDFASLPRKQTDVIRREVILGTDDENIVFDNDDYSFVTQSKYKFVELDSGYHAVITSESGQVQQIPFSTSEIKAPFLDFEQYTIEEFVVSLPNYDFGTYYPYIIEIDDGFISDITVFIKTKGESTSEEYRVNYVKYFEESFSKTVFLRKLTSKKFVIEFGSGIRGAYVPSSDVTVTVKVTKGSKGDITKNDLISPNGYITVINYFSDSTSSSYSASADSVTQIDFNYSSDGLDPLSGDELRREIVAHIQSYDMLVDELDFYNIASKYISDFRFLFKKSNIQENIFYLCRSIRDKYQIVVPTENLTFRIIESDAQVINLTSSPTINLGGLEPTIYEYIVVPSDNFNNGQESAVETVDLTTTFELVANIYTFDGTEFVITDELGYDDIQLNSWIYAEGDTITEMCQVISKDIIDDVYTLTLDKVYPGISGDFNVQKSFKTVRLEWDASDNAQKYIIYRKKQTDPTYTHFAESLDTIIYDYSADFGEVDYPLDPNLVFFPSFVIDDIEMVSPFLYKKNDFMNWYDGYLLYEKFSVYFAESTSYITNYDIPTLYFFIEYNYLTKTTSIKLKSNQDISVYEFKISINEVSYYNIDMVNVDNTTFEYKYTDDYGIFWDSFQISLNAYQAGQKVFSGMSNDIMQIYNISDELVLLNFEHIIYSNPNVIDYIDPYIINVPLLDKETYLDDTTYYLDKTKRFIYDQDIKGKRMVSDNLQFRFLNTIKMSAYYAENFLLQAYTHDIVFPLKMSINIITNQQTIINEKINLTEKKDEFIILVADWLQKGQTSPDIKFYNSQVVDLIHTDRPWIKSVEVTVVDSNDTLIVDGIETLSDRDGLKNIKDEKVNIVKYAPWLFHWDIDNIDIKMSI